VPSPKLLGLLHLVAYRRAVSHTRAVHPGPKLGRTLANQALVPQHAIGNSGALRLLSWRMEGGCERRGLALLAIHRGPARASWSSRPVVITQSDREGRNAMITWMQIYSAGRGAE
jgi:hypothetical protein